jgi:hypothetical protein
VRPRVLARVVNLLETALRRVKYRQWEREKTLHLLCTL